jgi:long-chain acyl-CoA synthetase
VAAESEYALLDLAEILFTSGTTGVPKGIMLSNENILENIKGINDYLNVVDTERFLLIKPLHHSSTLNGELLLGLLTGQTVVLTNTLLSPNTLYNLITSHQISVMFATPSLLRYLLEVQTDKLKILNETLKIIHFYGAPLPENFLNELIEKYPDVELIYSYGLTEASPRVTYIKKSDLLLKPLSSGVALYNVSLKIFDENHLEELKTGEIGEICVKGKNVMKGYFGNRNLSETTISDGWLKTGDLGFLDTEGYLFHKGRKDDLIIKGAINIYPAEIENIIYELPAVQEVLVAGIDSIEYGKKIIAYIVIKQGYSLSETDVNKHLLRKLEAIKCPDQIRFVEKLDLTESGKIKRTKDYGDDFQNERCSSRHF